MTPHEGGGPCVPGSKVHPPFAGNRSFMTGLKHVVWCFHEPSSSTTASHDRAPPQPRVAGATVAYGWLIHDSCYHWSLMEPLTKLPHHRLQDGREWLLESRRRSARTGQLWCPNP